MGGLGWGLLRGWGGGVEISAVSKTGLYEGMNLVVGFFVTYIFFIRPLELGFYAS
jgi:hypothetical protein